MKIQHLARPGARTILTAALLGLLGACGGGGSGGGSDTPPQDAALDTPEAVARAAALSVPGYYLQYLASAGAARAKGVQANLAPHLTGKAAGSFDCTLGGNYTQDAPRTLDVASPFTTEALRGTEQHYHDCMQTADDGTVVVINGDLLRACPQSTTDDGLSCAYVNDIDGSAHAASYSSRGSPAVPFVMTYEDAGTGAFIKEIRSLTAVQHGYSVVDADGVAGRSRYQALGYRHTLSRQRLADGTDASAEMSAGESDTPYSYEWVTEQNGATQFTFLGRETMNGDGCELGTYSVQTVQPMRYTTDPETGEVIDASGGVIDIGQDGKTARLTINADRSVTVIDSRNHSTTYATPAAFEAALGDCARYR
ncbi:hypothetical protein [Solimonas flava]|uniref:hypothetical protein n=1 Tax=Solimonas flava TaxID=415849 RepID=UPI0012B5C5C9|nr:hypothetical protein [Solimonas flava]